MSVDPAQLEGRTFEGGSTTLEPWLAYLWSKATAPGTGAAADETGWAAPPSTGVAIAREATSLSTIEETLRAATGATSRCFSVAIDSRLRARYASARRIERRRR